MAESLMRTPWCTSYFSFSPRKNRNRVLDVRLAHEHDLEAAFERGVFLDVLAIFVERGGADGAQLSASQRRLQHVRSVDGAFGGARADQRVQLVDEENDLALRVLDFLQHSLQAVFEFAAILRAGEHRSQVERHDALVLERFRHVARNDALRQAFDDGRLAHARLADQHRIILGAPRKHLHHAANFFIAADHGIEFAAPRLLVQVARITLQRLVLRFRILVGNALRSSNRGERLQDGVVRRAVTRQQLLRRIALQTGQRQQHVLGRNVFVLEGVGFLERLLQNLIDRRRHSRRLRAAAARDFRQLLNFFVEVAEHRLRPDADFFEHRRNDAFAVLDQRGQQMERSKFRIAVLGRELVRALDGFLRFDCEFVPTNGHGFRSRCSNPEL